MLSNNFHARIQLLVQSLRENSIVIESRKRISMAKSIIINPRPGVWGERRLRELKNFYFRSFPDSTKHVEHGALGMGLQVSFSIEWPWNGINVGHDNDEQWLTCFVDAYMELYRTDSIVLDSIIWRCLFHLFVFPCLFHTVNIANFDISFVLYEIPHYNSIIFYPHCGDPVH